MAENGNKTQHAAPVTIPPGKRDQDYIVCNVGSTRKSLNKYEIVWPVPNITEMIETGATLQDLSDWLQNERNLDLQDMINQGMRNLSYKPPYGDVGFDFEATPTETPDGDKATFVDYPLKENGHENMQAMADNYRAGQRKEGQVKVPKEDAVTLNTLKALASEKNLSMNEIVAMIEKKKAKA